MSLTKAKSWPCLEAVKSSELVAQRNLLQLVSELSVTCLTCALLSEQAQAVAELQGRRAQNTLSTQAAHDKAMVEPVEHVSQFAKSINQETRKDGGLLGFASCHEAVGSRIRSKMQAQHVKAEV